jgi:hypothetical protein
MILFGRFMFIASLGVTGKALIPISVGKKLTWLINSTFVVYLSLFKVAKRYQNHPRLSADSALA